MPEKSDLGGTFTLPNTSITLNRMGYGAMQLAGQDGDKRVGGSRAMFQVRWLFCARPLQSA